MNDNNKCKLCGSDDALPLMETIRGRDHTKFSGRILVRRYVVCDNCHKEFAPAFQDR